MKRNFNRSLVTYKQYQEYLAERNTLKGSEEFTFQEEPERVVKEYKYWTIKENRFPYDAIFDVHHMIVPKRVFRYSHDMTEEERKEYEQILDEVSDTYDGILENFARARSVKAHFHPHLFTYKKIDYVKD